MLQTQRLGMRLLQLEHIDYLAKLHSDPDVRKYFPDGTQDREQTKARMNDFISFYKNKGLPCFVLFELDSGEFVGRAGFGLVESGEVEVGYVLHKKFWGKGYASEVMMALLGWAKKNLDQDYIIAYAPVEHLASLRVMQKCRMEEYKNEISNGIHCRFYRIMNRTSK